MGIEWRNNAEPIDGEYVADVDAEDGSQVQTFRGSTYKEVADKLLSSAFNASRRINELRREVRPDPKRARLAFAPRVLSADERFQAARDMQDPSTLPEAVDRIVEARLGASWDVVRERLQRADDQEVAAAATAETKAFVDLTPSWYPTAENKQALWDYMQENGLEFTAKNFGIAYDKLVEAGLVTLKPIVAATGTPEENASERTAPQPTTRPRGNFASGVRSADAGGTPPKKPQPKYTRQEIATMSRSTYAAKLSNEAGFAAFVNSLG